MTAIGSILESGKKGGLGFKKSVFLPFGRTTKGQPSKKRKTVLLSTLSLLSRLTKKASHETKIGKRRERKCSDEFSAVVVL
jgi:hypothetical protein